MGQHSPHQPGRHSRTPGDDPSDSEPRIDRRRFIGLGAAGAGAAAVAALGIAETAGGGNQPKSAGKHRARPRPASARPSTSTLPDGVRLPTSEAIIAENAKTGAAWWVTTPQNAGDIEGYADHVSAVVGDRVTLFVSTKSDQFHVEAYRMGYYQGIGARRVWQSAPVPGRRQPLPTLTAGTNTIECHWTPSTSFTVDHTWPPGVYLLKLVGTSGEQQFVPLCVRDDASRAAIVIQQSVTTWQAYNRWGGYSLYYGNRDGTLSYVHAPTNSSFDDRARIVSFDRPYDHDWASGAADLVGNEFPLIFDAERLGLDVTYWTDIDLHARPHLLTNHRALFSLGHDEYWSTEMRDGATAALDAGVNLAFLGANACYRQIRLEASPLGPNRHQVCYKSAAEDPMTGQDDALVTVNWPDAPVSRPEAALIGSTYQDVQASADMVIADPSSWVLAGVDLGSRQVLPKAVEGEFDRYVPGGAGPTNVDVVAHSIVPNRHGNYSDVTWYTVSGGGGVLATGNASWVGQLADCPLVPPNVVPTAVPDVTAPLLRIMENVYSVLGSGPASVFNASQGNWNRVYTPGSRSINAPSVNNTA